MTQDNREAAGDLSPGAAQLLVTNAGSLSIFNRTEDNCRVEVNVDTGTGGATCKSTIEQRGKADKPQIYLDEELLSSSEHYHPNRPLNQGR